MLHVSRLHVEAIPAIAWFPDVMALSIINTRKINRKGATTNRIMVELLFRNATLAAKHNSLSACGVCMCVTFRPWRLCLPCL